METEDRLKGLIEYILGRLVSQPDQVSIDLSENHRRLVYQVRVAPEDVGVVIGRAGRTINAIRALLKAIPDAPPRVWLELLDERDSQEEFDSFEIDEMDESTDGDVGDVGDDDDDDEASPDLDAETEAVDCGREDAADLAAEDTPPAAEVAEDPVPPQEEPTAPLPPRRRAPVRRGGTASRSGTRRGTRTKPSVDAAPASAAEPVEDQGPIGRDDVSASEEVSEGKGCCQAKRVHAEGDATPVEEGDAAR